MRISTAVGIVDIGSLIDLSKQEQKDKLQNNQRKQYERQQKHKQKEKGEKE